MKKALIWIVAILIIIGIAVACVFWYQNSITIDDEYDNEYDNEYDEEYLEEDWGEELEEPDTSFYETGAIFTLNEYPKVEASLEFQTLANKIAADFLGVDESEINFSYKGTDSSDVYKNLVDGELDIILTTEISEDDEEYAKQKGVDLSIIPFAKLQLDSVYTNGYIIIKTDEPDDGKVVKWCDVVLAQRGSKQIEATGYEPLVQF